MVLVLVLGLIVDHRSVDRLDWSLEVILDLTLRWRIDWIGFLDPFPPLQLLKPIVLKVRNRSVLALGLVLAALAGAIPVHSRECLPMPTRFLRGVARWLPRLRSPIGERVPQNLSRESLESGRASAPTRSVSPPDKFRKVLPLGVVRSIPLPGPFPELVLGVRSPVHVVGSSVARREIPPGWHLLGGEARHPQEALRPLSIPRGNPKRDPLSEGDSQALADFAPARALVGAYRAWSIPSGSKTLAAIARASPPSAARRASPK